ncbi:hypothetical protein SALBM311S_09539 [Streptomyces alboniger]
MVMISGMVSGLRSVEARTSPTMVGWSPSPSPVQTVAPAATGIATIRIIAVISPLPPSLSGVRCSPNATTGMTRSGITRCSTSPASRAVGLRSRRPSSRTGT